MYWINKYDLKNNKKSFYCDAESDVANLPTNKAEGVDQEDGSKSYEKCTPGCSCLVIETGDVYLLKSTGNWKKVYNAANLGALSL